LRAMPPKAFRGIAGFSSASQTARRSTKVDSDLKARTTQARRQNPEVYVQQGRKFCKISPVVQRFL
jgi:hypothetical protein